MMVKDFFSRLAQYVIALAIANLIYALFLLLWPYDVLVVKNVIMKTPVVQTSQSAIYQVDYCKKMEAEGVVYYELTDESGVIWNSIKKDVFRPAGCGNADVPIFIPPDVKPGKYKIRIVIHYHVNRIRDIVEEFETPFFEVISQ